MKLSDRARFATRCIHAGQEPDPTTGAIITPIYQTSTYVQERLGDHKGYEYARTQNPTRMALEANVAALEGGRAGLRVRLGDGRHRRGAPRLEAGDHVVVSDNTSTAAPSGCSSGCGASSALDFTYVDTSRLDAIAPAFTAKTKLLFMESPTNPMLSVTDIAAACEIAHRHGVRVVVDNTFASPYVQRPLALGADIVLHSTTKFLNGHSDSVGGVVVVAHQDDRGLAALRPECRRGHPRPDGQLAGPARHQDAADPDGAHQRQHAARSPSSWPRTRG